MLNVPGFPPPGPTLEEIARLFDGEGAAVASEETVERRVQEKTLAVNETSQLERVKA